MLRITGTFTDKLISYSGEETVFGPLTNQIQDDMAPFIAAMIGNFDPGAGIGVGINQIAFGEGNPLWFPWDGTYAESPVRSKSATELYNEFATQAITTADIAYVDPITEEETSYQTSAIKIVVTRPETDADELHGEFAIYGAYNALTGERFMLNWGVREEQITKAANSRLETTLIFKISVV